MRQHHKRITTIALFMPPEAVDYEPVHGPTLDVFSFGCVVLHITKWPNPKSK